MNMRVTQVFEGFRTPGADFAAVRNGLQTLPLHYDVDLSTARSGADCLVLDIAGTDILIDAGSTGVATIEFQNSTFTSNAPIKVTPGFTASFAFTRLRISNTQQVGKTLRIIYGVDTKFASGQVSIVGSAGVNFSGQPYDPENVTSGSYGISGVYNGALAALTLGELINPAMNAYDGLVVNRMDLYGQHTAAYGAVGIIAATGGGTIPAIQSDVDIILLGMSGPSMTNANRVFTDTPFFLEPGWGLYVVAETAQTLVKACAPCRVIRNN